MRKRRILLVILALAVLLPFVLVEAEAGKGGKKKPPPEPPGEPAIACRFEGGKGKNKGLWLSVYDLGGNRSDVLKTSLRHCSWAPDGEHIAFGRGTLTEISSVAADGTDEVLLFAGDWAVDPAWSPDGDTIAYGSDNVTQWLSILYLIPAVGGTPQAIHTTSYDTWIESPTWNAAGTHVAFLESDDGGNPKQVRAIAVTSGDVYDVATISASFIEWARTDDVLLYATAGEVYTLDMASGISTYVTDGSHASWSPDDTEIVVERNGTLLRHVLATGVETEIGRGRFPNWRR